MLTARLRMRMVRRAWLRLECLLRACAEVRRLREPAGMESCRGDTPPRAWHHHHQVQHLPNVPPRHGPSPGTLQEEVDDGLQALKIHAQLVLGVEAAGFAPAQGQGARRPRAQQVPDLGRGQTDGWQRGGSGDGARGWWGAR